MLFFRRSGLSSQEVINEVFSIFDETELKILESDECPIPHMKSFLLENTRKARSRYSREELQQRIKVWIYPFKIHIQDPRAQAAIYSVIVKDFLYWKR